MISDSGLPDVGDVALGSCSFKPGEQYCGKLYFGEKQPSAEVPLIELPVRVSSLKIAPAFDKFVLTRISSLRRVHHPNALNSATLQTTGSGEITLIDEIQKILT